MTVTVESLAADLRTASELLARVAAALPTLGSRVLPWGGCSGFPHDAYVILPAMKDKLSKKEIEAAADRLEAWQDWIDKTGGVTLGPEALDGRHPPFVSSEEPELPAELSTEAVRVAHLARRSESWCLS